MSQLTPTPPTSARVRGHVASCEQLAKQVALLVQRALNADTFGRRVRVLADEVRFQKDDGGWWYVPVTVHRDEEVMASVYLAMSDTEVKLMKKNLHVLLVPRIIPFSRNKDAA